MRHLPRALPLGLVAALGCQPAARELAAGPGGAAAPPALVQALADRFGPIERDAGFEALRSRLARSAMVPSRAFDDESAWTVRGDDWRAVELAGYASGGAYHLGVRGEAPAPAAAGQYRGRVRLQRLSRGRFEWSLEEELAAGGVRPADLARALDALFRAAEGMTEADARAAIGKALPRAAARLGLLVRLETLALQGDAHGATSVTLAVRLTPDGIRGFAPRYAAFLDKYEKPMRMSLVVADLEGVPWWTLEGADRLRTARLRVRGGSLVPLAGPAHRRLPPRLRAVGDYTMRMGGFKVGARQIQAEVTVMREPGVKGFTARFVREPDWQLPFLVEPLLDAPLRYPFESPGSEFGFAAREAPGGGLRLVTHSRARVRESWLLRWLGGMAGDAASEFRRGAEKEADQFHREWLLALRDDLAALAAPGGERASNARITCPGTAASPAAHQVIDQLYHD
ncbi:MAG TPA: hypothetical protein VII13_11240 [Vicinamibacteria bacterium]|jgi:hypothetical protein